MNLGAILTAMRNAEGDREAVLEILKKNRCSPGLFNAIVRVRIGHNWIRRNEAWAVADETECTSGWRGYGK
tara:strand:+ start:268 stop:480 length:213 start_codon:yes stop_codon:yes gene_type:complete